MVVCLPEIAKKTPHPSSKPPLADAPKSASLMQKTCAAHRKMLPLHTDKFRKVSILAQIRTCLRQTMKIERDIIRWFRE